MSVSDASEMSLVLSILSTYSILHNLMIILFFGTRRVLTHVLIYIRTIYLHTLPIGRCDINISKRLLILFFKL